MFVVYYSLIIFWEHEHENRVSHFLCHLTPNVVRQFSTLTPVPEQTFPLPFNGVMTGVKTSDKTDV